MSFKSLLKHECTIKRSTTSSSYGVETKAFDTTVATGVKCAIQERSGKVESTKAGEYHEYSAVGYFLPDVDLKPRGGDDQKDRIEITAPAAMNTFKFLVIHVGDESGRGHHLVAYLKRLP